MKKLSIALYIVLLISVVSSGMLWVYAEPSSEVASGGDSTSVVTSQDAGSDSSSGTTESTDASQTESGTSSSESEASSASSEASSEVSSAESSSKASSSVLSSSSKKQTSSAASKTPPPYQDEGYIYGTEDEEGDYVQVTSDSLSQPADSDGDGVDDAEEEKRDNRVAGRIARVIWIPIVLAVASAAALITINLLYRKKYGKLLPKKEKKKKDKKTNLYIPRD